MHFFLMILILFGSDGKLAGTKVIGAAGDLGSCWKADVAFIEAHKDEVPAGYTVQPYCTEVPATIEAYNHATGGGNG